MNVTEAPGSDNSRQTMRKPGDVYLRCNLDIDSYQGHREPQQRGDTRRLSLHHGSKPHNIVGKPSVIPALNTRQTLSITGA